MQSAERRAQHTLGSAITCGSAVKVKQLSVNIYGAHPTMLPMLFVRNLCALFWCSYPFFQGETSFPINTAKFPSKQMPPRAKMVTKGQNKRFLALAPYQLRVPLSLFYWQNHYLCQLPTQHCYHRPRENRIYFWALELIFRVKSPLYLIDMDNCDLFKLTAQMQLTTPKFACKAR